MVFFLEKKNNLKIGTKRKITRDRNINQSTASTERRSRESLNLFFVLDFLKYASKNYEF